MKSNNNIFYYLFILSLFILLKFCYTFAVNDHLVFLLKPIDAIIEFVTGSHAVYSPEKGYYHNRLMILIEKSCSGFNFMLLCFCMLAFLSLNYVHSPAYKRFAIFVCLGLSYILTVFANSSRIIASLLIQRQANNFLPDRPHLVLHEAVGVITNLTFLILIYILTEKFLNYKFQHAKPA